MKSNKQLCVLKDGRIMIYVNAMGVNPNSKNILMWEIFDYRQDSAEFIDKDQIDNKLKTRTIKRYMPSLYGILKQDKLANKFVVKFRETYKFVNGDTKNEIEIINKFREMIWLDEFNPEKAMMFLDSKSAKELEECSKILKKIKNENIKR